MVFWGVDKYRLLAFNKFNCSCVYAVLKHRVSFHQVYFAQFCGKRQANKLTCTCMCCYFVHAPRALPQEGLSKENRCFHLLLATQGCGIKIPISYVTDPLFIVTCGQFRKFETQSLNEK